MTGLNQWAFPVSLHKWARIVVGLILVFAGFVLVWTPLPVGLPLMLVGLPLLIRFSPTARGIVLKRLRRHPGLARRVRRMAPRHRGN